jgi:hypothetical protein
MKLALFGSYRTHLFPPEGTVPTPRPPQDLDLWVLDLQPETLHVLAQVSNPAEREWGAEDACWYPTTFPGLEELLPLIALYNRILTPLDVFLEAYPGGFATCGWYEGDGLWYFNERFLGKGFFDGYVPVNLNLERLPDE